MTWGSSSLFISLLTEIFRSWKFLIRSFFKPSLISTQKSPDIFGRLFLWSLSLHAIYPGIFEKYTPLISSGSRLRSRHPSVTVNVQYTLIHFTWWTKTLKRFLLLDCVICSLQIVPVFLEEVLQRFFIINRSINVGLDRAVGLPELAILALY